MAQALTTTAALAAKLSTVQVSCRSEGAQAPHAVSMPGFSGRKVASSMTSVRGTPLVAARRTPVAAARAVSPIVAAVAAEPVTEAEASLNGVRGSALKVRRVVDQIRGRSYEEALMILEFMPYRACDHILKVLYSAAANAKNNYGMSKSKLYIKTVTVDAGAVLKRFRPRAQGRAAPIRKPTFSVRIVVAEREEETGGRPRSSAKAAPAPAAAAAAPAIEAEAAPAPAAEE